MVFLKIVSRPAASASTILRPSRSCRASGLRRWQTVSRRGYASAADAAKGTVQRAGGDLPWMLAAVTIAVPGVWFASRTPSNQHDESGAHVRQKDVPKPQGEPQKQGQDFSGGGESGQEGTPMKAGTKEGEAVPKEGSQGDSGVEGVKFKGPSKLGEGEGAPDSRMSEPDATGVNKERIDSAYGTPVGKGVSAGPGDEQAQRQQGFSNTDTKHSTDVAENPEKSKKAEGTAESAKVKGTVQADRPQK